MIDKPHGTNQHQRRAPEGLSRRKSNLRGHPISSHLSNRFLCKLKTEIVSGHIPLPSSFAGLLRCTSNWLNCREALALALALGFEAASRGLLRLLLLHGFEWMWMWMGLVRIPVSLLQKGAWVKPTTAATTSTIAVDSDDVVKENNIVNKV